MSSEATEVMGFGAMCRAALPQTGDTCGRPATHVVTFHDGDRVPMCQGCALRLQQMAGAHGTRVKVEKTA